MANELVQYTVPDMRVMAQAFAKSNLFGVKTEEQALTLMLISQAEGRHPALAAKDYDIIQNKPAKKSDAMLRDFLSSGGKVEWHTLDDTTASATFSHPQGGTIKIDWDMNRAKKAGLGGKEMWGKYPRQMLRARVVSEGIRTVCPAATSGMYVPEEVKDFDDKPMKDVTPKPVAESRIKPQQEAPVHPETGEVSPHAIDTADWTEFGKRLSAGVKSAQTIDEYNEWLNLNASGLVSISEEAAKLYARLETIIKEKGKEFKPTAPAAEVLPPDQAIPSFLGKGEAA